MKMSKKELSFLMKPWINKEIKLGMSKRDQIVRKYCNSKQTEIKEIFHAKFKNFRNQVIYKILTTITIKSTLKQIRTSHLTARYCLSIPPENIRKPKGFLMF